MPLLRNTKIKNAKKDSNQSSGSTGQLGNSTFGSTGQVGSTFGSTGQLGSTSGCPGVSDNYDCVYCDPNSPNPWHCNLFQFLTWSDTLFDAVVEKDVWASEVIDFSISKGQEKYYLPPTSKNIMSNTGGGGILVQAGRHGTAAVAQSFLRKAPNLPSSLRKPYGVSHSGRTDKLPEKLNFWVTVNLTFLGRPNDVSGGTIENVTFGQGSCGFLCNDWWIISPNCAWRFDMDSKFLRNTWYFHCYTEASDTWRHPSGYSLTFVPYSDYGMFNNKVLVCTPGIDCRHPGQPF